jgi:nitrite reductase/ring-hydroxylating ferredoxin subunit
MSGKVREMAELFAICSTFEVDDGGARGFVLARPDEEGNSKPWSILITRKSKNFYGFENACPHDAAPVDMDDEGNFLTCGRCRSQFDMDTGYCFSGAGQGKTMTTIPLVIDDGDVCLTGIELAEEDGLDITEPGDDVPEVLITGD